MANTLERQIKRKQEDRMREREKERELEQKIVEIAQKSDRESQEMALLKKQYMKQKLEYEFINHEKQKEKKQEDKKR